MRIKILSTAFCGILLGLFLGTQPALAETKTFEYTAKSWLQPNQERKEAEMLATTESFMKALEAFAEALKTTPAYKKAKVSKSYLPAIAFILAQDTIIFDPQTIQENGQQGIAIKTRFRTDTIKWPDDLDVYYQEEYVRLAIIKIFFSESAKNYKKIQAYVNKLATVKDPAYLNVLRRSEGQALRDAFASEELSTQAQELLANDKFERAEELLNTALQKSTIANPLLLYTSRMQVYEKLAAKNKKYWDPMLKDLSKLIALHPQQDVFYYIRGAVYFEQGIVFNQAHMDFSKSIELNPAFGLAYHLRGHINKMKGNCFDALRDFQKACELGIKKACEQKNCAY